MFYEKTLRQLIGKVRLSPENGLPTMVPKRYRGEKVKGAIRLAHSIHQ